MKKTLLFSLYVFSLNLYFTQSIMGFHIPDSLKSKNFENLRSAFDGTFKKSHKNAEIYANCILLKAKREKSELRIADGYSLLFKIKKNPLYLDSMILVSKKSQNSDYISYSKNLKGNYYYSKGEYLNALENYLIAKEYAVIDGDRYNVLSFNIGLLKLELGNYQEAQTLFLNYKEYIEKNKLTSRSDYLSCLYAIAYTYSKMNQINDSDYFVKLGLEKNIESGNKEDYSNLLLVSGINSYKKKEYNQAKKTLEKASKIIKNHSYNSQNLAISKFYIGMSNYETNNILYLDNFKSVDSIIIDTKNITSELRNIYPKLIEYYKESGDKENQLFYIEHLLEIDSILNRNNYSLSEEINKKYDTPILLKEKELLISELGSKNYILIWTTAVIFSILGIVLLLYFRGRKKIKSFEQQAFLLAKEPIIIEPVKVRDGEQKNSEVNEKSKIKFSNEKLNILDAKLEYFEKNKKFLNNNISLDNLAKEFDTNRDYLSKSVNELKGKNFSQYINELRIQYIIEELKTNTNLQKFTIAGIAEEAGYKTSESFTNSFKKITGTLPSYYLKALEQSKKENS